MRESINQDDPTKYEDPGPSKDFLFEDNYNHLDEKQSCEKCCDATKRRNRNSRGPKAARASNTPWIHYGLIGSANTLMISSKTRNSHRDSKLIICFEMEAIGVLHVKRGLVIRGISDYSDSHKNKAWQKYAAATAAAYAKELLLNMSRGKECGTSEIWKALHENVPNPRKPDQVQAEPVEAQSPTVMVHSEASTGTCLANSTTEEIANVVPPMCRDG